MNLTEIPISKHLGNKRIHLLCIPHGKRKSRCKECGGNEICEHDKRKNRCIECGGSQIGKKRIHLLCLPHGKRKSECKECGGSQICEHGLRKIRCIECGGSQICEHSRQRSECKECTYLKACHECGTQNLFYKKTRKEDILAYNRNVNIKKEYNFLAFTEIRSELVILGIIL